MEEAQFLEKRGSGLLAWRWTREIHDIKGTLGMNEPMSGKMQRNPESCPPVVMRATLYKAPGRGDDDEGTGKKRKRRLMVAAAMIMVMW